MYKAIYFYHLHDGIKNELMNVFDRINQKYGKSTLFSGLVGTRVKEWELIKEDRSPRYTTQWDEILNVKANKF